MPAKLAHFLTAKNLMLRLPSRKETRMNFQSLSDPQLLDKIHRSAKIERSAGLRVLHCLREIEARDLHLKRGFASLHEYLVRELKYSDGAAHRRLNAMRLLKELPEVEARLSEGSVSLSTASQLQDFFRAEKTRNAELPREEKAERLSAITGKSARETQA